MKLNKQANNTQTYKTHTQNKSGDWWNVNAWCSLLVMTFPGELVNQQWKQEKDYICEQCQGERTIKEIRLNQGAEVGESIWTKIDRDYFFLQGLWAREMLWRALLEETRTTALRKSPCVTSPLFRGELVLRCDSTVWNINVCIRMRQTTGKSKPARGTLRVLAEWLVCVAL